MLKGLHVLCNSWANARTYVRVLEYKEELQERIYRVQYIQKESSDASTVVKLLSFCSQVHYLVTQHQATVDKMAEAETCNSNNLH
jgi:hypothetical protein